MEYSKWPFGIRQFRDYVNEHADILIRLSEDTDGKNYWNCICSAMDWMDLAIEEIDVTNIDDVDWCQHALQIYMYISLIDIVWESIKQIHKMFIDEKTTPFDNDNSIFQDARLGLDDNRYFMHIRAAFGAHPVKLKEGRKKEGTETIRYASWPTSKIYDEYDYSVMLYSGNKGINDIPFGFKVNQIMTFFESRYGYLEEIENAIEKIVKDHCKKKKCLKISKVDNPIDQLEILKKENNDRLNNEYYDEAINNLTSFFQTKFTDPKNDEIVSNFTNIFYNGIEELFEKLSIMEASDLHVHSYLYPKYSQTNNFGYTFSKLSDRVLGHLNRPLIMLEDVIEPLQDIVSFKYDTFEELYWLTIIALNIKNGNYKTD